MTATHERVEAVEIPQATGAAILSQVGTRGMETAEAVVHAGTVVA